MGGREKAGRGREDKGGWREGRGGRKETGTGSAGVEEAGDCS